MFKSNLISKDHLLRVFISLSIFFYPVIVFLFFISVFSEIDFYSLKLQFAEKVLFTTMLFLSFNFIRNYKIKRRCFVIGYILLSVTVFFEGSYYSLYSNKIGASTIFIFLESNTAEIAEYLGSYFSVPQFGLILLLMAPLFFLPLVSIKFTNISYSGKILMSILFLGFTLGLYLKKSLHDENLFVLIWRSFNKYKEQSNQYELWGLHLPEGKFEGVKLVKSDQKEIYVLVIGESITRHRMGLYEYPRQNNPQLSKIKNELFIFRDVISPHTHTIPSLAKMMGLKNHEINSSFGDGTIIQLMNQAGFTTYWLSNQRPVGWNENLITKMAKAADKTIFINDKPGYLKTPFDGELLPKLDMVLDSKDNKSFIVIHLLGAHNDYSKRYPPHFSKYKEEAPLSISNEPEAYDLINSYDNAIQYNDEVLAQIIHKLKTENASSYMLFVSDHGEDVYQVNNSASHTEINGTKPMYDVPFVLWTSPQYHLKNHLVMDVKRKYMLNDLIFAIADLSGIAYKGFDPSRSVFNCAFIQRKRYVSRKEYEVIFRQ